MQDTQIPLGKKFHQMPRDYKDAVREYFLKILPYVLEEETRVSELGLEGNLESFEGLVEDGGLKFEKQSDGEYKAILFNLITKKYEDITNLKEDLKEIEADED